MANVLRKARAACAAVLCSLLLSVGLAQDPVSSIADATTSPFNVTTTALAGDATYTGRWEISTHPDVLTSVITDADGTLFYDFSNDRGVTYTSFPTAGCPLAAGIHSFHTALKGPRAFRIRIVNGSDAQSYLRAYTYYGSFPKEPNSPLSQSIAECADATLVRTLSAELDLAFGRVGGMSEDAKFGHVLLLDAADGPSDVWAYGSDDESAGGLVKTWPATAQSLYVASSNASDTDVDVVFTYTDANGLDVTDTVNLNGQTAVDLGVTGLDVWRARTVDTALGDIYFTIADNFSSGVPATPSQVLAMIPAGYGQTQQIMRYVPANSSARIKHVVARLERASGAAGSAEVWLMTREPGSTAFVVRRPYHVTNSSPIDTEEAGLILQGGTIFLMRVADVSDTDTNIGGKIIYELVEN